MRKTVLALLVLSGSLCTTRVSAQADGVELASKVQVKNPFIWADAPDPDVIRVGDYYYLVTTTMHLFPGGPIMRSKDLVHWETISYLFNEIKDTPRYDFKEGTVYGRGQWATSLRYHKGTFWALFVANDDPHKSMVFKTDDPTKGWTLHSRLPAYHDSSLFFDDDDRVYVFSGSGDIHLVELTTDLTAEKPGGIRKTLELHGKPRGLHEGSRVVKHDGMYYLLCIAWPNTGREEICYRSSNIEGPYESKVILKSDFGGFPLAGQGTIVNGKNGEWYGVIFQDRAGVGRVLTIEPCSWIDGWPMLGNVSDGKIPETLILRGECECHKEADYAVIDKDFQFNHNYMLDRIAVRGTNGKYKLMEIPTNGLRSPMDMQLTAVSANSIFDAHNTLTWRMPGPTCSETICINAKDMKDGDKAGFAAFNGDSGVLTIEKNGSQYALVMSEQSVRLSNDTKAISAVESKVIETVKLQKSKVGTIYLRIDGDFRPGANDAANFYFSTDGKNYTAIGTKNYRMRFDYMRMFMGTRFAAFYYSTKSEGGKVQICIN